MKVYTTHILTTSRSLLNIKVKVGGQGHTGFLCVLSVHDTGATRGYYLALNKA